VPGGVDGVRPDATGHAVSGRLSDGGVHRECRTRPRGYRTGTGARTFRHRAWVQVVMTGGVPLPVAAGVGRRSMRIAVLSGQPRTCRPRGLPWPAGRAHGRTLGAGGVRRLAVAVRTGSRPIGWAVTSNWGCPADRTVKRSAMSVARPATARVSAGGTDRRRWCPGGCPAAAPWRKRAASRTAGMSGKPRARSSRCPPG
jgi:hypothetical protein